MDQELFDKVMAGFDKEREPKRTVGGTAKDVGISAAKGILGIPEMALGALKLSQIGSEGAEQAIGGSDNALVRAAGRAAGSALNPLGGLWRLDKATGGHAGRALNYASGKVAGWQEALEDKYSDAQKAANKRVEDAEGFWGTTKAALQNPSTIAHMAIESLPTMWGGAKAGQLAVRGGLKALEKAGAKSAGKLFTEEAGKRILSAEGRQAAAKWGGRLGEGLATTGAMAEQISRENGGAPLTAGQGLAALAGGAATSAIGTLGSKIGGRFGASDIDELLAGSFANVGKNASLKEAAREIAEGITAKQLQAGIKAEGKDFVERQIARQLVESGEKLSAKQIAKGIAAGTFSEAVLEELPQSMQEQVWQNIATGKAWSEGVLEAGAQGMLAGGLMGGGANIWAATPGKQRQARAAHAAEAAREAAKERKERMQAYAQWRTSPEGKRTRAILSGQQAGRTAAELEKARRDAAYWEQLRTGHAAPGEMESLLAQQGEEDLTPAQREAERLGAEREAAAGPGLQPWVRQSRETAQAAEQARAERRQAAMAAQEAQAEQEWADRQKAAAIDLLRQVAAKKQTARDAETAAREAAAKEALAQAQAAEAEAQAKRAEAERVAAGYQPTGQGMPVTPDNSLLAQGQATEAGQATEQRAARQEDLEEAFSQPATTPRYEAVALEDADIAARQRKTERQAREQERIAALSQRTWEPGNVPPELAERLDGLRRQMDAGEAGQKFFTEGEDGELHVTGMASTNPVWMRRPGKQEAEADPDRALLSSVGKKEIRNVLDKGGRGETLTDRQQEIWSALQRKAWRHGTDDYDAQGIGQEYEDYQYAAKRGINLEAPREVAAGSLQDGDTVLVRDREGEIDAASVSTDPSTGTVTIRDGVVRKFNYDEPVQIEGLKPAERPEESAIASMFAEQEANEAAARAAALEAQAESGTIGKALSAGGILASDGQQPGLGVGPLMQANGQEAAEDAAELAQNQSALLGLLDTARREQGRAERPERRQAKRQAKAQRVKAAKHRQHEARFAEIRAPYGRVFAGTAEWNDIIPNAQGFIEETRGRERQDLARGAYGTSYATDANSAAERVVVGREAAKKAEAKKRAEHESDLRIVRGVLDGDAKMTKRFNAAAGKKKETLRRLYDEERKKREEQKREREEKQSLENMRKTEAAKAEQAASLPMEAEALEALRSRGRSIAIGSRTYKLTGSEKQGAYSYNVTVTMPGGASHELSRGGVTQAEAEQLALAEIRRVNPEFGQAQTDGGVRNAIADDDGPTRANGRPARREGEDMRDYNRRVKEWNDRRKAELKAATDLLGRLVPGLSVRNTTDLDGEIRKLRGLPQSPAATAPSRRGPQDAPLRGGNQAPFTEGGGRVAAGGSIRYLRNSRGLVIGAYHPGSKTVLLTHDADAATVLHEIGWHAVYDWARANAPELHRQMRDYAQSAPESVKQWVRERYGDFSAEALLDEIGAKLFTESGRKEFEQAVQDRAGRSWYRKVTDLFRDLWNRFTGANRADLGAYRGLSPEAAMGRLLQDIKAGRRLGESRASRAEDRATRDMLVRYAKAFGVTPAQLQAEYEAVVERYKDTPQWRKAPNGEDSNLNERQWVLVRTPRFKAWFGDWEISNAYNFAIGGEPVAHLTGQEFQKDGVPLTQKVPDFYRTKFGGVVTNPELGAVQIDTEGVKDSLGHGVGSLKSAAFAAVPEIIQNGVVFNREADWKGRGYDTAVIVAPITIGGVNYVGEVVVKRGAQRQGFYLHEVEISKGLEKAFKTATGSAPQARTSRLILSTKLEEVKNSSKVVDENGEPLVVWRGSPREMGYVFEYGHNFYGGNKGFWFTSAESAAKDYAFNEETGELGETKAVFLNARNIMDLTPLGRNTTSKRFNDYVREKFGIDLGRGSNKEFRTNELYERNQDKLYPGSHDAVKMADVGHTYIVKTPTQIKSATDNTGAFDPNEDDIRYTFAGEQGAAALDAAEEGTHRLDNLAVAREMEAAGKDAKTVKLATGWERGKDGKWRYEIDDGTIRTEAQLGQSPNTGVPMTTLERLYDAPELFKAYPALRNMTVEFVPQEDLEGENRAQLVTKRGPFGNEQVIQIRDSVLYTETGEDAEARIAEIESTPEFQKVMGTKYSDPDFDAVYEAWDNSELGREYDRLKSGGGEQRVNGEALGSLVHEIQHAIQHIEGFATGGMADADTKRKAVEQAAPYWQDADAHNEFVENVKRQAAYSYAQQLRRFLANPASFEKSGDWFKYKSMVGPKGGKERQAYIEDAIDRWRQDMEDEFNSLEFENGSILREAQRMSSDELKAALGKLQRRQRQLLDGEQEYRKAVWEQERLDRMEPLELYRRLAGEVEARNVQRRLTMTAEERRASLAEETEDVAREDQIVLERMLGGAAASAETAPSPASRELPLGGSLEVGRFAADGQETQSDEPRRENGRPARRKGESLPDYNRRYAAWREGQREAEVISLLQAAWHGSPYQFSRFTLEHMGKGEGAQVHGWGLYFALGRNTAEGYRERLGREKIMVGGREFTPPEGTRREAVMWLRHYLKQAEKAGLKTRAGRIKRAMSLMEDVANPNMRVEFNELKEAYRAAQALLATKQDYAIEKETGQLYRADIPEDFEMLREDAPLAEQPAPVREALKQFVEKYAERLGTIYVQTLRDIDNCDVPARRFMNAMGEKFGSPRAASLALNKVGIKGIRYRGGRDGECAVVWDDTAIEILETYYQAERAGRNPLEALKRLYGQKRAEAGQAAARQAEQAEGVFPHRREGEDMRDYIERRKQWAEGRKEEIWRQVQEQIRNILPDKAQANAIIGIIEARAKSAGISAAEFVHRRGLEFRKGRTPGELLAQGERLQGSFGLAAYRDEGRAIISAFEAADVSTPAHELAHMFRQDLERFGQKELLKAAEKWAGVKDGKWTREQEEKFARAFERYLREGKAPTRELKGVFARFRDWLTNIYRTLKGSPLDVRLSPEITRVFDALLTENAALDRGDALMDTGRAENAGELNQARAPYDPLTSEIMRKEHTQLKGKHRGINYVYTADEFHVYDYYGDGEYDELITFPIEGNEDLVDSWTKEIDRGLERGTKGFAGALQRIQRERSGNNRLGRDSVQGQGRAARDDSVAVRQRADRTGERNAQGQRNLRDNAAGAQEGREGIRPADETPDELYQTQSNPANNNAVTGQSFIDRILDNAAPKWRDRWERFIYNFLDSNDPRERVWKRAGSPSDKDFVTIERLRGKKAAAEQKRFKREMLEPLLDTLGKAGLSVSDLEEYAHALHTPERNQRMREVNAKRTLDELMKNMPDNDRQALKDQIDFIRTVGKQNGWTESDIQKAYLDLMRDVYRNIPAREQAQRQAERALSPNSSQAQIDRVAKGAEQLAETKRIRDKWQEESVRFAGMTDADAASIIQKWQGDGRYAALQKAQRQLAAINAATLDVLHEAGELGDEEYQAMKNGYQFYVPLHRDGFQDTRPPAVGRSTGPIGSPFKVAKGSMRAVVNILANSVQAHETAINRRHKLEAGRALYEFAQAHPDAGITVERQEKKPTHDKEGNIVMYTSQAEPEDGVFVKVDGVKYLLRFNTDNSTPEGRTLARFLDSVKGADAQLGGMVKMLHQATRWLAAVNTSFSPEFVVTNFSRDFQTAFIHLNQDGIDMDGLKRAVAKDVFPAMRGIFAAERGNRSSSMAKWYADYEANGGKVGWMQSYEGIEDLAGKIQNELKLHQDGHHAYKAWRGMRDLVENANAAIENCMRLATYKALVERGVSRQKAAMVASSLTVDFTQRGKMSPQINALYMFFNASVQGTVRMVQAMATSRKVQAIAGGIAGAGFVLQMLALAGGGDDDSGEPNIFGIPESTRERNIIIMLPGGDGKKYIKIPKAYGYGALYDFGAELANSIYMSANGRKYDHAKGAMRVVSSFANSFNPIQSATLLQALSPTLLDPVVYTAENKSWAGTPLMPEQSPYGPPKPDSERAWKGTSPIFKKLAQTLNDMTGGDAYKGGWADISPETFSMLWDTGTGGMGRFVGNVVSLPFSAMEGEVESRKIPFLRQVYGEWNDRAISSRYYEAMDRAEIAHMRFKNAESLTERKRLYQEPDHKLYLQSRESEKRIKAMRKRQQLMEAAGNKDGAERMRQRIVEEQAKVLKMAA